MKFGVISLGDNRPDTLTGKKKKPADRHDDILDLVVKSEELGFDSFHIGEHHGCDFITSTPAVFLAAAAMKTKKIRLSTATALLPTIDPIRFAEDYATLDLLSHGRAEVIVSRGIIARSYLDLGFDYAKSNELFKEKILLVLQLWKEENVSWEGISRPPINGYTMQPRPLQKPTVPMWVGGGFSEDSVLLAAEMGLPLMLPSVIAPPTQFVGFIETYREKFQDRGFGKAQVGALCHMHCAKDMKTVRKRFAPRQVEYVGWVGGTLLPWGLKPFLPEGEDPTPIPPPDFDYLITEGPVVAGSPQQVLDRLSEFKEVAGLDRQLFHVDQGALPQKDLFESLELVSEKVLPHLR